MDRLAFFRRVFVFTSAVGFTLLWPMMLYNGTLFALLQASWTGVFRDGRPLLTTYTHFPPFDFMISILVAFFDEQINGSDDGAWILMLDLVTVLQVAALWVWAEANRSGQKHWLLEISWFWSLTWNLCGAAIVLPLYLYLHTASHLELGKMNLSIFPVRPKTSLVTSLCGAVIPAFYLFSACKYADDFTKHAIIAFFVFSPLLLAPVMALISSSGSKAHSTLLQTTTHKANHLYLLAALASGMVHMYCMAITWLSQDESIKIGRVFVPRPSSVIPGSINNIHDGALLFLQYDWIVVNVTCTIWALFIMDSHPAVFGAKGTARNGFFSVVSTLLVGPGATMSYILYLREEKLLVDRPADRR